MTRTYENTTLAVVGDVTIQTVANNVGVKSELQSSRRLISDKNTSKPSRLHVAAIWEALQDGVLAQEEEHQIIPDPGQQ